MLLMPIVFCFKYFPESILKICMLPATTYQLDARSDKEKTSNIVHAMIASIFALAEYKDIAVRRVKLGLLLSENGKDAKVTITPDDINKAIMNEAKKYQGQEKAVFDYYLKNKQAIEALKAPVFEEKIVDYVIGKSNVSEKIVSIEELYSFDEDKKAGKKTTAKKSAKKSA